MDIRTISSKGQVTIKKNQGLLPYLLVVNQTMEDQVRKMISSDKKPSEKNFVIMWNDRLKIVRR